MTAKNDEPLSILRQLELMRDLQRLANDRWQDEVRFQQALADGLRDAEKTRETASRDIESRFTTARETATAEYERLRSDAQQQYEQERNSAQQQYKGLRQGVESEHSRVLREAVTEQQETSWETMTVFDAIKGQPRERMMEAGRQLRGKSEELAVLENDATAIMKMRRQWREFPPIELTPGSTSSRSNGAQRVTFGRGDGAAKTNSKWADQPGEQAVVSADPVDTALLSVDRLTTEVREEVLSLYRQRLPQVFEGGYPAGICFAAWLIAVVPTAFAMGWQNWWWIPVSLVVGGLIGGGVLMWLRPRARHSSGEQFQRVRQLLAEARHAISHAAEAAQDRGHRESKVLIAQRDQELAIADKKLRSTLQQKDHWKDSEMNQAGSVFPTMLSELRARLEQGLSTAESEYNDKLAKLAEERERAATGNEQKYDTACRELRTGFDRAWEALATRWLEGYDAIRNAFGSMAAQCARLFPDWEKTNEQSWPRPTDLPAAIAFGQVNLDLASIKNGIPQDERLRPARTVTTLPALMTLKEHPRMVLTAEDQGRREAIDLLQLLMLRFLTGMPPGKVRFTILDPVGLGESFASFMHLADFDEQLVSSRIWTESRQIEEQLTRLTNHMETVLQKYLRNEFATIDDYNSAAGEVAEPFHVLVAANFPANFTEEAARKLVSIGTSGPRCGVYTLLSVDRKLRLPNEFRLEDLLADSVHLDWQPGEQKFRWKYPAFERLPLALDHPPSAERFNDVVRAAGRAAKDSMRVEVPFSVVAPAAGELWKSDCGNELAVPIGRAGAMRLQSVRLGKGTSQHLLVCGKTGSGKSTFLHAFITNAALYYGPDQIEFYLIDFKKGVEFKTYATHHLPHARVIAIESEREFGLSVLERLDAELRRRGELFRTAGVQDLPGYRAARPGEAMPRVLLVVDEFQELFVEDDKLSQEAALLLDRLVRQGRAFGMHVMLGSQTLGGAYSLPRSTMGQMAVRVALQCSEADAHIILSDERNMAARYLNRPGEAIYNDQNGLLVGNQPFQVVWLSESQRVDYLEDVLTIAEERGQTPPPAIVFEGDQAADPGANTQLAELLAAEPPATAPVLQRAWLGAAVAIKEPTFATFSRNGGSNLLVVGGEEESALGVLANAAIALAAQNPAVGESAAKFVVLDGSRPDAAFIGTWQRLADALPHDMVVAGPRDTARVIGEIAEEIANRESATRDDAPPIFLVVYNAGRIRELRRSEDDFGFSMDRDKKAKPDKQWGDIVRNGPTWGVHSLVWCDSYNDVTRLVDRQTLREFELRVVFQMSAADSTNVLDTPAASKLRQHRGLFYSDDLGTSEKFRPYGPPSEEWLARVRESFADRVAK